MKRSHWTLSAALIVVVGGLGLILATVGFFGGGRPNVILISLDTCRADYISCYGRYAGLTPNIDALSADGFVFKNAISPDHSRTSSSC